MSDVTYAGYTEPTYVRVPPAGLTLAALQPPDPILCSTKGKSGIPIPPTRTRFPRQFPPSKPHSTSLLAEPDAELRRALFQGPERHRDIEIAPGEDQRTGNDACE